MESFDGVNWRKGAVEGWRNGAGLDVFLEAEVENLNDVPKYAAMSKEWWGELAKKAETEADARLRAAENALEDWTNEGEA